jgi:hypothetical protein
MESSPISLRTLSLDDASDLAAELFLSPRVSVDWSFVWLGDFWPVCAAAAAAACAAAC